MSQTETLFCLYTIHQLRISVLFLSLGRDLLPVNLQDSSWVCASISEEEDIIRTVWLETREDYGRLLQNVQSQVGSRETMFLLPTSSHTPMLLDISFLFGVRVSFALPMCSTYVTVFSCAGTASPQNASFLHRRSFASRISTSEYFFP